MCVSSKSLFKAIHSPFCCWTLNFLSFGFLMRCLWKVPLNLKQCWHSYRHISFEETYSVTFTFKIYLISDISIDSLSEVWLLKYFLAGTSDVRSRISLKKQRSNSSPLIHSIAISLNWSLIIYSQWTEISSPWWNLMHLILFKRRCRSCSWHKIGET